MFFFFLSCLVEKRKNACKVYSIWGNRYIFRETCIISLFSILGTKSQKHIKSTQYGKTKHYQKRFSLSISKVPTYQNAIIDVKTRFMEKPNNITRNMYFHVFCFRLSRTKNAKMHVNHRKWKEKRTLGETCIMS